MHPGSLNLTYKSSTMSPGNPYDLLLEFNINYEALSYRYRDIIAYFPKNKEVT